MNKKSLPVLTVSAFALLLLSACGTPSVQAPLQVQRTSETFAVSKDKVWPFIVSEIGLDYPVRAIEKDSGLITTDWVTLPAGFNNMAARNWIFPVGGFLATWNGLRMNLKVLAVEPEPGKTQVTINCHYEAFENNVQHAWLVAESNGAVENAILTRIEKQLAAAPAVSELPKLVVASPVGATKSPSESLIELKKLLDAGVITQADFDAKKKALLEKL